MTEMSVTPFFKFILKTFMKHFIFSTREVGKPSYLKVVFMSLSGLFSPVKKCKSLADPQIKSVSEFYKSSSSPSKLIRS